MHSSLIEGLGTHERHRFGATGAIGQYVLSELLAAGHTVTVYARNPAKVPSAWPDDVRLVIGHLMLMKPAAPIKPGDEIGFTLTLGDGSTVAFRAVAKPFAGADESYAPTTTP